MKTQHHDSRDRIRIAQVSGALSNLAGRIRRDQLDQAHAVAELHAITTDPHLLGHGLGGCLGAPDNWVGDQVVVQLAIAAGVDLDEAAASWAEMHPAGGRGMRLGREG